MRDIFAVVASVCITVAGGNLSETFAPAIGLHVAYFTGVLANVAFFVIIKEW
jgi:hypothetical protein